MSSEKKILFIVGASRSGTTMMSRILGRHSTVFSLNELHVFGDLITPNSLAEGLNRDQQKDLITSIFKREEHGIWQAQRPLEKPESVDSVLQRLANQEHVSKAEVFAESVRAIAGNKQCEHVAEQTPRNIFYASALLETYPQAHIVHMVRDPRAVLASQKSKWRRKFLGGDAIPFLEMLRMWLNYHPITLSKLWISANIQSSELQSNNRFHTIKFEALLEQPEHELTVLCSGIGIDFESNMLDIDHVGSSHQHNTAKASGVSNTTVESWRSSLSRAEHWVSEKLCGQTMKQFGYTSDYQGVFPIISMLLLLFRFPIHIFGVIALNFDRAMIQLKSLFKRSASKS